MKIYIRMIFSLGLGVFVLGAATQSMAQTPLKLMGPERKRMDRAHQDMLLALVLRGLSRYSYDQLRNGFLFNEGKDSLEFREGLVEPIPSRGPVNTTLDSYKIELGQWGSVYFKGVANYTPQIKLKLPFTSREIAFQASSSKKEVSFMFLNADMLKQSEFKILSCTYWDENRTEDQKEPNHRFVLVHYPTYRNAVESVSSSYMSSISCDNLNQQVASVSDDAIMRIFRDAFPIALRNVYSRNRQADAATKMDAVIGGAIKL